MTKDEKDKLDQLIARFDERAQIDDELKELLPTLKELAQAWKAAGWFGRAIKWVAGIVGAFAVIAAAIRYGMPHK